MHTVNSHIRCDTCTEVLQKLELALRHLGFRFQRKVLAVQNGGKYFDDIFLADRSALVLQIQQLQVELDVPLQNTKPQPYTDFVKSHWGVIANKQSSVRRQDYKTSFSH